MGQHRYRRMDGLPDADQGGFPLPRFDLSSAALSGFGPLHRFSATRGHEGHSGMALLLLQEPDDGPRPLSRAQPLHSGDEAEEHAALSHGRRANYPSRPRVL